MKRASSLTLALDEEEGDAIRSNFNPHRYPIAAMIFKGKERRDRINVPFEQNQNFD